MEERTGDIIRVLKECNSIAEVQETIIQKQKELKDSIIVKYYKISDWDEEFEEYSYEGEDALLVHTYQEVNHIRLGLSGRWIHMIGYEERYGKIENVIKQVLDDSISKNRSN